MKGFNFRFDQVILSKIDFEIDEFLDFFKYSDFVS